MKIYKLQEYAEIPSFATEGSACFDLKTVFDDKVKIKSINPHNRTLELSPKKDGERFVFQLQPQFRTLLPTGLIFDIPEKHMLSVHIRSSMAYKYGITLANSTGIIDSDYVEELYIMVINTGDTPINIYSGDRVAQARLEKLTAKYTLEETTERPERKTDRDGGIGSTGVN